MKPDYLAKEAARLAADDVLNHALADMKAEALADLLAADAADTVSILRAQQRALVVEDFRTQLERYVQAVRMPEAGNYA